jgi:hypothetical protein
MVAAAQRAPPHSRFCHPRPPDIWCGHLRTTNGGRIHHQAHRTRRGLFFGRCRRCRDSDGDLQAVISYCGVCRHARQTCRRICQGDEPVDGERSRRGVSDWRATTQLWVQDIEHSKDKGQGSTGKCLGRVGHQMTMSLELRQGTYMKGWQL